MAYVQKRTSTSGKPRFRAMVRVKGFPTRCATFTKHADARDWASGIEADMRASKYGGDIVSRKYTVRDMIKRYLDNVLESKSTKKRYVEAQRKQLEWWQGKLGECRLNHLTPFMIADCKDELAGKNFSKRKPATVNRYLAALSHVINTAIREWGWLQANPLVKIAKPKEPRGRVRFLTDKEREDLLAACQREVRKPLYLIVVFALCTGARKHEILTLKRKDVDLSRKVAVAYDTKNSEPRQLYLWDQLCRLLVEWLEGKHSKSQWLFPSRAGDAPVNIEVEWRRALKAAGIYDFRFHDLRHTAASYLAMNGASTAEIAEVLGHKSLALVKRYAHLSQGHTASVVAAMNQKVFGREGATHAA